MQIVQVTQGRRQTLRARTKWAARTHAPPFFCACSALYASISSRKTAISRFSFSLSENFARGLHENR
jgi:hypothetical protein